MFSIWFYDGSCVAGSPPHCSEAEADEAARLAFAEQLLASQRKFAESVLHATTPMIAAKNGTSARKTDSQAK